MTVFHGINVNIHMLT